MNIINRLRLKLRSSLPGLAFRFMRGDFRGMPIPDDESVDAIIETEKTLYARFKAAELKRRNEWQSLDRSGGR